MVTRSSAILMYSVWCFCQQLATKVMMFSVCPCVHAWSKFVSTICYGTVCGNLQLRCTLGQRWTHWILKARGQGHSKISQQRHINWQSKTIRLPHRVDGVSISMHALYGLLLNKRCTVTVSCVKLYWQECHSLNMLRTIVDTPLVYYLVTVNLCCNQSFVVIF